MKIEHYLRDSRAVIELKGRDRDRVIAELAAAAWIEGDRPPALDRLCGPGEGRHDARWGEVAIPHVRTRAVSGLRLAFGRSAAGVPWGDASGDPVRIVWLVLDAPGAHDEYLAVLSEIARISRSGEFRARVIGARDRGELLRVVRDRVN